MRYLTAVILLVVGNGLFFASHILATAAPVTAAECDHWGTIIGGAGIVSVLLAYCSEGKR